MSGGNAIMVLPVFQWMLWGTYVIDPFGNGVQENAKQLYIIVIRHMKMSRFYDLFVC